MYLTNWITYFTTQWSSSRIKSTKLWNFKSYLKVPCYGKSTGNLAKIYLMDMNWAIKQISSKRNSNWKINYSLWCNIINSKPVVPYYKKKSKPVVHGHKLGSLNLPMIQSDKHLSNFSDQTKRSISQFSYLKKNQNAYPEIRQTF